MRILQICHRIPYPPTDGGNIVMMNLALALADSGQEVFQFALNTQKHYTDPESIPASIKNKLHFRSASIDTKITYTGIIKNFFTKESYNIVRFYSKQVEDELIRILQQNEFDIVELETLFSAPYIPCIRKNSKAQIVLRAHNVEHVIWERLAVKEKNIFRKKYLKFLAKRLKDFELKTLEEIDALVPITEVDEQQFIGEGFKKPSLPLPMSIDLNEYPIDPMDSGQLVLFHLGSMDWLPNLEAVKWFLENCWEKIHVQFPDLKLYLAGRCFPEDIIRKNYPNVTCEGRIEKAVQYMKNKQIMIVPLHSGSGMRVKIIQGMALGKTVISTSIGAEGIPVENGKNILIADTPEAFINKVKWCMQNKERCIEIGNAGRKFVEEIYSNEAISKKLICFYEQLLKVEVHH